MEKEATNLQTWIGIILFLFFAITLVTSLVMWSLRNGISPMPSSPKAKKAILSMIPEKSPGTIYELGCGWGSLLIPLAKQHAECHIIGFETSFIPYWFCRLRLAFLRLPNVNVQRQDFYFTSLEGASLVVCYLYPEAMRKLKYKFLAELDPKALIISNTFAIQEWIPKKVIVLNDLYHSKIYLYQLPELLNDFQANSAT
jgi:hypothetical protein